jgi:hypothetical protein
MYQELKLQIEERIDKTNFEEWKFFINNVLKSNKILKYVKSDVIGELKKKLNPDSSRRNRTY